MDDDLVEEYARMNMDDVPPILISGNNFVDGGHRLHSHKRAGSQRFLLWILKIC